MPPSPFQPSSPSPHPLFRRGRHQRPRLLFTPIKLYRRCFRVTATPPLRFKSAPIRSSSSSLIVVPKCSSDPDATVGGSDLAPIPVSVRTFTAWDMASLWVGLVVGVPAYYLVDSLVNLGMSWWQGVATIVIANLIVFFPLVLTDVLGTRYGVPFPILAHVAFGVRDAHVPTLLRALVSYGWYDIETWIDDQAVFLLLPTALKSSASALAVIPWLGTSPLEFSCFLVFWLAQMGIILRGMDEIRELENISYWATLALNIPDFTRYARNQKDQILGQVDLPVFMGASTFLGLGPSPSVFTFRKGTLLTALLSIAFQPWRLLSSSESFVYTRLLGYFALMGPIRGIILADYYLVKRMELDVSALSSDDPQGPYYYQKGLNVAAMAALVAGILPILPGFLHKVGILASTSGAFVVAYNNAWFVSLSIAGVAYWFLSSSGRRWKGAHNA
ncbi:hypothetical protein OPV22_030213 [Ensete ventricosum]|uniref:Uncharacterized protein n=1 Tax=Ensete ventricosum TaxID=4639 RepID=A0AAV8QDJ2_ENSVE|nr:hypothetical protein OPV22_030213 [Ensete ventricosum]